MQHCEIAGRLMLLHLLRRNQMQRNDSTMHPGQLPILEALLCHPGSTQQELSDLLHVTPASIALSAKRLQKSGLVKRCEDGKDRRRNRLYATEQGAQLAAEHRRYWNKIDSEMLAGFSKSDIKTMCTLLDRMLQNLGADEGDCLPLPPENQSNFVKEND